MTDTVGLPRGWASATLPDVIGPQGLLTDGDWVETEDQDPDGDVRLTQLADIGDGVFRDRSARFMTQERAAALGCTFLEKGDVMVARMPDPLGRACLFPGSTVPSVTAVDVCIIRPALPDVDNRWLMHTLNSPAVRGAIAQLQSGSTRKRISKKNLCTIPLPVAPAAEQCRIADNTESYLTRLDNAVALLKRVEQNLKRYRASVLKAAVEGRLVPTEAELTRREGREYEPASELLKRILVERKARWIEDAAEKARAKAEDKARKAGQLWTAQDDAATLEKERAKATKQYAEPLDPDTTELPDLPEGWCWALLEQLTFPATSGSRGWAQYYTDDGPLFIRAQDLKMDALTTVSIAHVSPPVDAEGMRTRVQQHDLLVTVTGANVTKAAFVRHAIGEAYVSQHVGLCRPVLSATAEYVHLWIVCPGGGRSQLLEAAYGAGKPGLNLQNLHELIVALPPLIEQSRVVDRVGAALSAVSRQQATADSSRARVLRLRQAVLKWAFEGKLAKQDPNDESASVLLGRIREQHRARRGTTP